MMVSLGENFIKLLKAEVMRYGIVLLEALDSGIPWVVPLPSNSHHQDYSILSRGSQPKPSFAIVTGRGDTASILLWYT